MEVAILQRNLRFGPLTKFKMPQVTPYTGKSDSMLHIDLFREMMMI